MESTTGNEGKIMGTIFTFFLHIPNFSFCEEVTEPPHPTPQIDQSVRLLSL